MPTYEYLCELGHESELRQSMSDDPVEVCPREDCDAPAERQISLGGGVLVGGSRGSGGSGDGCGSGFT